MKPRAVLGVDPGLDGALAFWRPSADPHDEQPVELRVYPMPTLATLRNRKKKREIDIYRLAQLVDMLGAGDIGHCYLERVGAMPGQGSSSMFQFGRGVGIVEGVVAASFIPITRPVPQVWRKACGTRAGKDATILRSVEMFPKFSALFTKHGFSDATLIAWWGLYRSKVSP